MLNRRTFITTSAAAAATIATPTWLAKALDPDPSSGAPGLDLTRHRFGVNYTPSHNWWFCWNDWNPDPIRRDLDAIAAALGADHMRILLIWPFFQPNPKWVSPAHLERLDQLITLMAERQLDALVTVFTGQLSGWYFLPPFNRLSNGFFTDPVMLDAEALFIRELSRTLAPHQNVIGFDMGNEINTCWSTDPPTGDAWMDRTFSLMNSAFPNHLHVNGVDHNPWFRDTTFSPRALAEQKFPVMHSYPWWTGALKYGGPMDPPSVKLLAAMAALIRSYAGTQQKPIFAGEFNTCIEKLSEAEQAQWLEQAVHVAVEQGVSWFTYWDSHDVDRKYDFNPLEYILGLLTNDGKVKPAGHVFKGLAENYRGKPVNFPTATLPPPPTIHTQDGTWQWVLDWLGWKPRSS